jgi:hypothetical protein
VQQRLDQRKHDFASIEQPEVANASQQPQLDSGARHLMALLLLDATHRPVVLSAQAHGGALQGTRADTRPIAHRGIAIAPETQIYLLDEQALIGIEPELSRATGPRAPESSLRFGLG